MVLAKILKSAMVPQVPASVSVQNSAIALSTSANAMKALQQAGKQDLRDMNQATVMIGRPQSIGQSKANSMGSALGGVTRRYHQLKSLEKPFMDAMDSHLKAAQLRSKMATKAADVSQKVAVLDTETQAKIGQSHQFAAAQVAYASHAFGGSNFSV